MTKIPVEDAFTAQAAAPPKKTVQMPVGVPGYTLADEAREIPASEPPVWPINKDLKYVGQSVQRYDGMAKAAGRARYTSDVQLPGMLYAKFVNANVPHAKVISIDTTDAEKYPGVRGVHVIQHVLGNAVLRNPALDPVKYPVVRYAGQPLAAVAATTPAAAEEAAALVKVKYETIPFVVDPAKAREPDAPAVFPGPADEAASAGGGGGPSDVKQTGNIHGPSIHKRGETEQGFKDADVIVEGHFVTQVQTHSALETHGVVADWKPEMLTVYASTQGTAGVREELAGFYKIPLTQVRVITEFMGGGFGAKFGAGNPGVADARSRRRAPLRRQSAQFRSAAAYRSKEGRHHHGDSSRRLRHRGMRHRCRMFGPRVESLQERFSAYRGERRLHQRRTWDGDARAGTSAGRLRPRADDGRSRGETQHGTPRPA
jgi:xanthine dehydrogenase YagR molybdenum-binding subunit